MLCLLAAVVQMALQDLQKRQHLAEAHAFVESEELELFCDRLGWVAEAIRHAVAKWCDPTV